MPTSYTSIVEEGATFEQFVWRCARAFGALIDLRDERMDADIPERLEPYNYHIGEIAKAKAKLARLESMTTEERHQHGLDLQREMISNREEWLEEYRAKGRQYAMMRAKVAAWEPPTAEHRGLKDFMLEQLETGFSLNGWQEEELERARAKSPSQYFADALEGARRNVEYHEKEHAQELKRVAERNAWLSALRQSVAYSMFKDK